MPIAGIAAAALGLILLSRIPVHGTYLADLFPGLMVMSIGMGLTFVPVTLIATTNIDAADSGLASGLFIPVSELNHLRQSAIEQLTQRRNWDQASRLAERQEKVDSGIADVGRSTLDLRFRVD